jgi:cytochrome c oxidase subunit 2
MTNYLSNFFKRKYLLPMLYIASPAVSADWFALNMTRGITDISNEVFELHMLIFWICVAIGVAVFSVMFYSMWAHTKKKNPVPAKFHENHKLEIAWTIIPFLILIAMAVPASKTLVKIYDDEAGDVNIQITGYQWKWQYNYLEDDISFFSNLSTDLDEIYNLVPKGENYLQEVDEMVVIPAGKKSKIFNYCKRCNSLMVATCFCNQARCYTRLCKYSMDYSRRTRYIQRQVYRAMW